MENRFLWMGVALSLLGAGTASAASRAYRVEAKVIEVTPEIVTVRATGEGASAAGRELQFRRTRTELRVGDQIVLWYTIEAERIEVVGREDDSGQQPGKSGQGKPLEDDRIFLHAERKAAQPDS